MSEAPPSEITTVHLLVNPSARRGADDAVHVADQLAGRGLRVEHITPDGPADVADAIRRAAPQRVIAVGGDGLIHHALPALVESSAALGIVPSGTGNDFARALSLPTRRPRAVDRAIGPISAVDVLRVERADGSTTYAASAVTAGFSGRVNATANARSFPKGQLKYTFASFSELGRLEAFELDATLDGGGDLGGAHRSGPCSFFAVANTRFFGGGMAIAPAAEPADGRLHLTVVDGVSAWKLALVLPAVFVGQHVRHPSVSSQAATSVVLDHDQDVWADGERIGNGRICVSVVPSALFVAAF